MLPSKPLTKKELELFAIGHLMAVHTELMQHSSNSSKLMTKISNVLKEIEGVNIEDVLGRCIRDNKTISIATTVSATIDIFKGLDYDKEDLR